MDPTFFEINWSRTIEALTMIVILAFIVERVLTLVFDTKRYEKHVASFHIKPLVAFALSFLVCYVWEFDALSIILIKQEMNLYGYLLTAGVISGGSKGALELLRNIKMLQKQSVNPPQPDSGSNK